MRIRLFILVSSLSTNCGVAVAETPRSALTDEQIRQACKVMAQLGERPPSCVRPTTAPQAPRQVVTLPARPAPVKATPQVPIAPASATAIAAGGTDTSQMPFWLLRQDQYDQVSFITPPLAYQVLQGASVSYSDDQISKSQSLNVKGLLGYSAYHWDRVSSDGCGSSGGPTVLDGVGIGPFVQADGILSQPTNANEKSALRVGINSNVHLCHTPFFHQEDWQFLPYAQTDFRGRAGMAGFDALWEPQNVTIHLGGRSDLNSTLPIDGYFRIIAEANAFHVADNGLTNFLTNTNYAFLGGTAEFRGVLFENNPNVVPAFCGTISVVGTARYLWDAVSRKPITLYGAEIDYKLGGNNAYAQVCKGKPRPPPDKPPAPVALAGTTSIALSYTQGTDELTFVKQNKYMTSLKFSY
jgi:hypothetical protein